MAIYIPSEVVEMNRNLRTPVGVPDLDFKLDGGVPQGYSVLSMGNAGAGYRELIHTAVTIHGNHQIESIVPNSVDVYQGLNGYQWPREVHYVSFVKTEAQFERELLSIIDRRYAETALDGIQFKSFMPEFMSLSTIPHLISSSKDGGSTLDAPDYPELTQRDYRQFLRIVGDYLLNHGNRNLIIIDGFTHLVPVLTKAFDWQEMFFVLTSLNQLVRQLNSVFMTTVNKAILSDRELGVIVSSFDGILEFGWEERNANRQRVMTLAKFRELLAMADKEELKKFEVTIDRGGFGIKNIRKISV